jgi:hypothetical protein
VKTLRRIWFVLRGDKDVFFEIGLDRKADWAAFGLVLVVSLVSGLGWILRSQNPFLLAISLVPCAVTAWWIFGYSIKFIETLSAGGGMTHRELLRLAGFAMLPLGLLSVPYIGWLSVGWFWGLMYRALRSFYSTKPMHTLFLVLAGSMIAIVTLGLSVVVINTALVGRFVP